MTSFHVATAKIRNARHWKQEKVSWITLTGWAESPVTVTDKAHAPSVVFAHLVFQINIGALAVDLYPSHYIATAFGIIGAGSAFGGMLSAQVVGNLVAGGNFDRSFLIMATLHPLALGVSWLAVRSAPRSRLITNAAAADQDTGSA